MGDEPATGEPAPLPADRGNRTLKRLDRWLGIPAVAVVGLARRLRGRRPVPPDWHTIGLLRTAAIGDTILLSGVVRDLRAARPDARIVVFVTATNAGFARLLDGPDEIIELPVRNVARAVRLVRAQHVDVMIDFGAWPRLDALLTELSGARCTVGRRTPGEHRHAGFDVVVDHSSTGHEVDTFRCLIAAVGVDSRSEPRLDVSAGEHAPLAVPYAVLHLWPGGANIVERSWPIERWRTLAVALGERGLEVVLTGGPGDVAATAAIVADWVGHGLRAHTAAGVSPAECLRWVHFATGVVSVNTGVMHLAAAAGTPTVALNGPTSCRRWGPVGAHCRCLASPDVPDGYLDLGFERDDRYRDCMQAITLDLVLAAWDEVTTLSGRG